ncbi:relaxase/mobilization nuclease domain-containing protein [Lentzea sp. NPDC092896]|uniref:relaxase/mobilization nuclease domain-containing protein n=1 Tax=Lentzea sp. NPDC092896 TaxID=3364127 RepID=UPI00381FD6E3
MIAKVVRGYRPAGLLRYLLGPGLHEEHRNPRVVASWDDASWAHQPAKIGPGEFDFDLRALTTTMQELAALAGLPLSNPPALTDEWREHLLSGAPPRADAPEWLTQYQYDPRKRAVVLRQGYVWHCPVRLHPDDPVLSDAQWEHIAKRLMKAVGIHDEGCRWIAVRHADDHIHLMATLVSERTGKRVYPFRDFVALREECRELERELGLVRTAGADKTALQAPTRKEKGKAARLGERVGWFQDRDGSALTPKVVLRRAVGRHAAVCRDGEEFLDALESDGLSPVVRRDGEGRIVGYAVSLPGDVTSAGASVLYSGSKLGADLSWPKLETRWRSASEAEDGKLDPEAIDPGSLEGRRAALQDAARVVELALAAVRGSEDAEDAGGIAHATGEVLVAFAQGRDGRVAGELTDLSEVFDRAARVPHRVLPSVLGPAAAELRRTARRIGAVGVLSGRGRERDAAVALVVALAALITEIAAWQEMRGRVHQAAAARVVARGLRLERDAAVRRPAGTPARPAPGRRVAWVAAEPQERVPKPGPRSR